MVGLAICSLILGAIFGRRFKVLVLLPVTLAIGLLAIPMAGVFQLTPPAALKGFVICALALQGGFVLGSSTRVVLALAFCAGICASSIRALASTF